MISIAPLAGLSACIATALLLRKGWAARGNVRLTCHIASAIAAIVAVIVIVPLYGVAAGLILIAFLIGVACIALIFAGAERRPPRSRLREAASPRVSTDQDKRGRWRRWARGAAAALLTLLFAEAVCAAAVGLWPGAAATRFATGIIIAPVVWAALIVWTMTDRRLVRPVLGMTGGTLLSGALIAATLLW